MGHAPHARGAEGAAAPVPGEPRRDGGGRPHGARNAAAARALPPALLAGTAAARRGRGGGAHPGTRAKNSPVTLKSDGSCKHGPAPTMPRFDVGAHSDAPESSLPLPTLHLFKP